MENDPSEGKGELYPEVEQEVSSAEPTEGPERLASTTSTTTSTTTTTTAPQPPAKPTPPPKARTGGETRRIPSSSKRSIANPNDKIVTHVMDGLKRVYLSKLRPLEEVFNFGEFASPMLSDADFDCPPIVLMLGQYSVGKTSFINYILEREFPGQRIGPEPTTDGFAAVMYGDPEKVYPGSAVVVDPTRPFQTLQRFGTSFLNKFSCSACPSPLLRKICFIDTPGILSGEKQRIGRNYDFPAVVEYFAERSDRILLLFDAHKLDISDEFKTVMDKLTQNEDKIRIVLNKADMVSNQQLMRVYGALMWSLGKVVKTPEVLRVYIGSFWDKPLNPAGTENKALFDVEEEDLLADLRSLPRNGVVRRINEIVKRARASKVHALLIQHLRGELGWFGKASKQQELQKNLAEEFKKVQRQHHIPSGDMPDVNEFRRNLQGLELSKFPKLNQKLMSSVDDALLHHIPPLMHRLPASRREEADSNPFDEPSNPFDGTSSGEAQIHGEGSWLITAAQKARFDNMFYGMSPMNGKVSGDTAKQLLLKTELSNTILFRIWSLSDIDKDGRLDSDEFAVAMYLCNMARNGEDIPERLPPALVPPSKRGDPNVRF